MKRLQFMKPLELQDLQLIRAVESGNQENVLKALQNGANPDAQKRHRGIPIGEPILLMAIRENHHSIVKILLEKGATLSPMITLVTAMAVDRCYRKSDPLELQKIQDIFNLMESHQVDWTVTDRFIGNGIRAIDLIAGASFELALQAASRMGLPENEISKIKLKSDFTSVEEKKKRVRTS